MYDFLIIGQGIAGSILAFKLMKAGKKVFIIDDSPPSFISRITNKIVSSPKSGRALKYSDLIYPKIKSVLGNTIQPKVIGGLITPVTGKRFVKTWMADQLLPFADNFYRSLENNLESSFYKPLPIVRLFANAQQANDWSVKLADKSYNNYSISDYIFDNKNISAQYGYTVFNHGAIVDGIEMLSTFHTYFKNLDTLKNSTFSAEDLRTSENEIQWKNIRARSAIFCEGWKAIDNPFFNWLPFMPAKGELLIIKSDKLKLKELINRGIFIRPLTNDLYLVGSTYTWNDHSLTPTESAKEEIQNKLKAIIRTDFTILDQVAGIRPTVKGRRPFLGQHPEHKNVFIFNGLGTKGLLLAPYFSQHFCDYLLSNKSLLPEVNINRFI